MKANELMIGDWVLDTRTGTPLRVNPFMAELEVQEWMPIPLTPEILEKNGFVYADLPFENFYEGYGLRIYGGNFADGHSNWYIICGINVSMNVTHVHELQHALKLCKIDKEIKL